MKNINRKGFTLIELLIVIVVIGILSAMMMLSSTEAVTSARASNIVSNLRNFKTAAMAMYVDNLDKMDKGENPDQTGNATLLKYMNNNSNSGANAEEDTSKYVLDFNTSTKEWYVKFTGNMDARVKAKLAGRAKSVGLLAGNTQTKAAEGGGNTTTGNYYTDGNEVYMFVTNATAGGNG